MLPAGLSIQIARYRQTAYMQQFILTFEEAFACAPANASAYPKSLRDLVSTRGLVKKIDAAEKSAIPDIDGNSGDKASVRWKWLMAAVVAVPLMLYSAKVNTF